MFSQLVTEHMESFVQHKAVQPHQIDDPVTKTLRIAVNDLHFPALAIEILCTQESTEAISVINSIVS